MKLSTETTILDEFIQKFSLMADYLNTFKPETSDQVPIRIEAMSEEEDEEERQRVFEDQ